MTSRPSLQPAEPDPSRLARLAAWVVPRVRRARDLDDAEAERQRLLARHATRAPGRGLPTRLVPRFSARFSVVTEQLPGPAGDFPSYVVTPRGTHPRRTLLYLHGGGYVSGIDPFQVRYATRLAAALGAKLVLPDYPLAPEHTWRDSHEAVADQAARCAVDDLVLAGDSAGGGYALALALTLRDRGGSQPSRMVLHAPWVDLTTSTPETAEVAGQDPWLHLRKLEAYAGWWAGSADDLDRAEVSPGLADLTGLPPALVFCGTRDLLLPGCRMLAQRAAEAGWDLRLVERPGLIHVYPLLPLLPEATEAWTETVRFLA